MDKNRDKALDYLNNNGDSTYVRNTSKNRKNKKGKKNVKKIVLIALISALMIGSFIFGLVVSYVKATEPLDVALLADSNKQTVIFDNGGNVLARISGKDSRRGELAKHEEIPQDLRNAIVAIEDKRFYEHNGVDLKRSIGATLGFLGGNSTYGGSTITQQLVKVLTTKDDRTAKRKVQEQWTALQVENKLEKNEILDLYINSVYMGDAGESVWGMKSAAKAYFNKNIKNLTTAECASLAGIVNLPNKYNPDILEKDYENNIKRQQIILKEMYDSGFITEKEYNKAKDETLKFAKTVKKNTYKSNRSYFVDQVIVDVQQDLIKNGMSDVTATSIVFNGGLEIHTTLDPDIQSSMDTAYQNEENFYLNGTTNNNLQSAMTIIDSHTGQVRAMYGGRGEKKGDMLFNRASQMERQIGSTMKPIFVYGPALNEGLISPDKSYEDKAVYFNGNNKPPYPENYYSNYKGWMTVENAVAQSTNTIAAEVWQEFNLKYGNKAMDYLTASGIDVSDDKNSVSLALGGMTHGTNPTRLAGAYTPFANYGTYMQPITYTKVLDESKNIYIDKVGEENTKNNNFLQGTDDLYKPEPAYEMTKMLRAVTSYGTASNISLTDGNGSSVQFAAKTGTTDSNKDRWFVGYSPNLIGVVWYGTDDNSAIDFAGENPASKMWSKVFNSVYSSRYDYEQFEMYRPGEEGSEDYVNYVEKQICTASEMLAGENCPDSAIVSKTYEEGKAPSEYCNVHTSTQQEKIEVCSESHLLPNEYCPTTTMWFDLDKIPSKTCTEHSAPVATSTPIPTEEPIATPTPEPVIELTPTPEPIVEESTPTPATQ